MNQAESKKAGKLVRLKLDIRDEVIVDAKIVGDFFIYPEDAINDIEFLLTGRAAPLNIQEDINQYIKENDVQLIGISPQIIEELAQQIYSEYYGTVENHTDRET